MNRIGEKVCISFYALNIYSGLCDKGSGIGKRCRNNRAGDFISIMLMSQG
jgi:hypothetical protein